MNARSFEERLQQITPPPADPAARLAARRAAAAEFERLHAVKATRPARRWQPPRLWMGGFATACVAIVGVSIYWMLPADEQVLATSRQPVEARSDTAAKSGAAETITVPPAPAPVQQEPTLPAVTAIAKVEPPRAPANESARPAVAATPPAPPAPPAPPPVMPAPAERTLAAEENLAEVQVTGTSIRAQPGSRSLTLTDGRRAVSESRQADAVDVNVIPSDMLQRADVVTGGASASYGAGAAMQSLNEVAIVGSRLVAPGPVVMPSRSAERFAQFDTNPVKRADEEPVSTFSVDVDTASYSFTRRTLEAGSLPPADAVRAEEMINYFDYAWPAADSPRQPLRPTVTVSDSPWAEGRKLVHIGIKGYELPVRNKPDVNLVLLLDVSGSMNSPDKLPLATRSVSLLLDSLKPTDTVAIAVYAGAAGQVLAPTPVRDRERIEEALQALRPGGSTAGAQGIQLAYQLAQRSFREGGVNRILLATDGDFNVGVASTDELRRLVERERQKGIYLSVLGFGRGNYRDDIAQTLAQNGNGVAAYIDSLSEARKVLVQQAGAALFTIASDVKIQVEFNPATVAEYRLVGYETRALNREDFNNDKVDAGEVGSGHTVTAIYEITPVGSEARQIDERRYADGRQSRAPQGRGNEYGFVKIRYKLPGEDSSRLLEQPIRTNARVPAGLRDDVAFSTAVAGFAQLLRGGQYTGGLTYDEIIGMARGAIGEDEFGYRSGFVELARRAREIHDSSMRDGRE